MDVNEEEEEISLEKWVLKWDFQVLFPIVPNYFFGGIIKYAGRYSPPPE